MAPRNVHSEEEADELTMPDGAVSLQDAKDPWLRNYFINRLGAMDNDRTSYWLTWKDLAQNFAPRRGKFLISNNDYTRGRRKDQRIIDNTPAIAGRVMASGMMAGISSPARPWFRLKMADDAANEENGARAWLDEVQKRILHILAKSNLYNCLHTLYAELGTFGTAVLWVDEDDEDIIRGYTLTVGEYWLASSRRLAVDTVYRTMWWTVRQIVDEFGREQVSGGIRSLYDNGLMDLEYEIVHAIEPNPNAAAKGRKTPGAFWNGHLASQMPYRSVWFERGQQGERSLLKVSGYDEFPCMAPRWEVAGSETYGSGNTPGWLALGDSQSLQIQQRRKMEFIDKLVKPPMTGPPSLDNKPSSLLPGGMTIVSEQGPHAAFRPAFEVNPAGMQPLVGDIMETQNRIKQAFYADLFLMMAESDRREITAREIDERHEEKMLMLGPVLERLHDELLDPLVTRVFNILARKGGIPPMPQGMQASHVQIEFISMLASAQKAAATGSIERYVQFGAQLAQVGLTGALDRIDVDGTMDEYGEMTGVPGKVIVDLKKAMAARDARAKQAQGQETLNNLQALATTAKTAGEIDVGGGQNAVSAAIQGATQ